MLDGFLCTPYLTYIFTSPERFLCVLNRIRLFNETIDYGNLCGETKSP